MTILLDQALAVAGRLPPSAQDEIAWVILQLAGATDLVGSVKLTSDEARAIAISKDAAGRGEFATDQQVQAVWTKHGL